MSDGSPLTYLITGCNRGIGRAIADIILARSNITLIALVRNPFDATSKSLSSQPRAAGNKIIMLAYDALESASAHTVVRSLTQDHEEIKRIDVVIACAGAATYFGPTAQAPRDTFLQHFQLNALGPLDLLVALLPFLRDDEQLQHAADERPQTARPKSKYIAISSAAGSTAQSLQNAQRLREGGGSIPYGMSKAALNHGVAKLRFEYPEVAFHILTPGATRTGFTSGGVDWSKMPHALSVEEVAPMLMQRIDEFKDNVDGQNVEFCDWKGDVVPW